MTVPPPDALMQIGLGFWASKTLLTAVELDVFSVLAEGPLALELLRQRLGLHPRAARDFLDTLVALQLLEREGGVYRNSALADHYLVRGRPSWLGGFLEMANRRLYPLWGRLTEGLRTGAPQNEARDGGDPFERIYADPATLEGFLQAMTGASLPVARALAAAFPWEDRRTFADIGCAEGGCAAELARAHPHLAGIGFDLPPVGPIFERYVAARGLAGRVRFRAGDFFRDPLPAADVLVMGHLLHDFDLAGKRLLLDKAWAALPAGGALLVYDAMIDDARRERAFGLMMSLNMLLETPGGFDYTGADCVGWMRAAGFAEVVRHELPGIHAMVVGLK